MKIHEYQAKEIMRRYGIPVQPGKIATTPEQAEEIAREFGEPVVIKAQVYVGGRGKAGGIQFGDTPEQARQLFARKAFDAHRRDMVITWVEFRV